MVPAISLILQFKYLILIPLAAIEGPMIALVAGFLVSTGTLDPFLAFGILLLGDIIPDSIYYAIGRYGNQRKAQEKIRLIANNYDTLVKLWHRHPAKTMFLGKLAYGLSQFFLISAGLVKMPYKKFMSYALPVTFVQFGALMIIGYYLGGSYEIISRYVRDAGIVIAIFAIVFFTIYIALAKYARKKVLEINETEK